MYLQVDEHIMMQRHHRSSHVATRKQTSQHRLHQPEVILALHGSHYCNKPALIGHHCLTPSAPAVYI